MAAPLIAIAAGWIGATAAGAFAPAALDAARVEAGVAIAYEDLRDACPTAQPLVDAVAARFAAHPGLARLARATDALCRAVSAPDTLAGQAGAVAALAQALAGAEPADPILIPRRQCGRTAC